MNIHGKSEATPKTSQDGENYEKSAENHCKQRKIIRCTDPDIIPVTTTLWLFACELNTLYGRCVGDGSTGTKSVSNTRAREMGRATCNGVATCTVGVGKLFAHTMLGWEGEGRAD